MNLKYEGFVDIPIKRWKIADEEDELVALVEQAGYQVIGEAISKGFTKKIKDIHLEVIPNFDDDRSHETIKVVLEYANDNVV